MRLRSSLMYLIVISAISLTSSISFAQITGELEIKVADSSAAVIPNSEITVRSIETGTTRVATSDAAGAARVTQLSIGSYQIQVTMSGFNTIKTVAVVTSGSTTVVPVTLEISTSRQEIVVNDVAAPINTVNSQLQNSVESREITHLPLVGGNVLTLAATAPGIVPVAPNNPFLSLGSFNSNGGRGRGNNITVDNATATDISTTGEAGLGTIPIDGIKEFNIITNNFNAEYGRNGDSQVQIITKGGTNEFHGRAFEYFRNDKLNARDYFDTTGSATPIRSNDWGGVFGGPIKRNKVFFFGTYEQQKVRGQGGTVVAQVPTTAQLSGPIDPTAAQLLTQLQVPSSATGAISQSAPAATNTYAYSGRIDANLTQNDFFYTRMGTSKVDLRDANHTFLDSTLATNGAAEIERDVNVTISETHAFSPRLVNQFLTSYGRTTPHFPALARFGGPEIQFADGTSFFGIYGGLPQGRVQNPFQYSDTVTYNRGAHNLKFGADINRIQSNGVFDSNVRGTFVFLSLDDFLAGNPFQYSQRFGNSVRGYRVWNQYYFAQDDYRLSRTLTLNLGVRLERSGAVTEVNNLFSNLDLSKHNALGGAGTGPFGSFDVGGSAFRPTNNWSPRVGFAWNPRGSKLAIRGGYGIAYDYIYLNPVSNMRFLPPFMFNFVLPATGFSGNNTFANIVAGTSDFQKQGFATVGNYGTKIHNFGSISPMDQSLRNPQVQQWSMTAERELPLGLVARVSYLGTKSNYLQRSHDINTIQPGIFTPPQTAQEEAQMRAAGIFKKINSKLNPGPTGSSIRIDPRFNRVVYIDSSANSNYHSAQAYVERRFRAGYSFSVSYTFSKSIDDVSDALNVLVNDFAGQQDPRNNRNNRAVSSFDIPQRLVIAHNFQPTWGQNISNRVLRGLAHGWEFAGIFQAQSGSPINLLSGSHAGLTDALLLGGSATQRPDLVGPINLKFEPDPGLGAGNPNKVVGSGLAQPLVGHFGTLGRNVVRLNPLINSDLTLGKNFKVNERLTTQFQAQAFNVFNNTTFSQPGVRLSSAATFGYYGATDTNSRNVTLVLRLIF
jgi:hypothetical protein